MFNFLRKKLKETFDPDAKYRAESIKEILSNGFPADKVDLLDRWIIEDINVNGIPAFMPRPLWDREAMYTRNTFPSEEAAKLEVVRQGGELL